MTAKPLTPEQVEALKKYCKESIDNSLANTNNSLDYHLGMETAYHDVIDWIENQTRG